jgi:hypothetical protein
VGFAASNKLTDGGIPPVLLLDMADLAASIPQEGTAAHKRSEGDEANYDTRGNGCLVG